ncbi:MAG: PQQ-binding-like beta-propeller repeat protein [Verrucomicrobiales bacterium]|nr:PQQ-binding-like beta-propeller repeat protein [Verrucomicrobiales bacterium]
MKSPSFYYVLFAMSFSWLVYHQSADAEDKTGAADWGQWGHDSSKNMVSPEKNIPVDISAGDELDDGNIDVKTATNAKWIVKLGDQSYGTPTVSGGRVFVGTNNANPRNAKIEGDRGVVMCFDEKSGKFLWQLTVPKLPSGKVNDWEFLGICSSPTIVGKYGYVVTNRAEVIKFDTAGLSDGNDGTFQEEGKYMAGGLNGIAKGTAKAVAVGDTDADIIWGLDMMDDAGAFPHNIASSSVVLGDGKVFASTSNGMDWSHLNIQQPLSPTLISLDVESGKLVGEEAAGISERTFHCNWSSPAYGEVAGKKTVVFGGGDGWCYGFGTVGVKDKDGFMVLPELWKVDCNAKEYRLDEKGKKIKYASYPGPSEIIASPVIYKNRVYVTIGQDPENGEGVGALTCIDPSKGSGEDAVVWRFQDLGRSLSSPSIVDGLLYIADYAGRVFCLDADSGKLLWEHDTLSHIWASTLVVDGKVFIGTEDGELIILKAGKEKEELATVDFPNPIYSTPVAANGALYIMTQSHLYAFQQK